MKKKAICGICPAGCWVEVTLDEKGRLKQVEPDESSSLGMICKLGEHSAEIVYSKDRLQYPMKRKGGKGTLEFERITWDEAFEVIVDKHKELKKQFGPESTSIYTGRGSFELAMCDVYQPKGVAVSSASSVLFPFGSPNSMGVGALCYVSFAMIAPHVTMGGMLIDMFSDIEQAQLVVVWGANPATDCPPLDLKRITKAYEKGAKVVVIDPRRTSLAKLENAEWVPIRPGTDGALALGLCNVLIEEELYDAEFVKDWTVGFDEFAEYVQHFRPEVVENITGVPKDTTIGLAREIASVKGASPIMYSGLEYSDSGVQAIRATQVLWALAGQLDVPGGRCFSMSENRFTVNRKGLVANPNPKKSLGLDRFPVYSHYRGESHAIVLPESVLNQKPYPIRSMIILGGSMITSWPEPEIWKQTLSGLDFLVTIDRQLTADSAYADIVLPATTMFEIESYMTYGPIFRKRERVVEPIGESRNDFFILSELAQRLGYGHLYPQNEEELLSYVLDGTGYGLKDLEESGGILQKPTVMMEYKKWEKGRLRKDGKPGFETPSGKLEIASSILEENGYDALPVYTEPKIGPLGAPGLSSRYPLVFNSGARVTTDFRSQHHGIEGLNKERPEPAVTMNPIDAKARRIENGDLVEISTEKGRVKMRALVTDDIVAGAIDANMGGGGPVGPKAWRDCNINLLTDLDHYDPISGFPVYKALLCEVEKAASKQGKIDLGSGEMAVIAEKNHGALNGRHRIYLDHNATTKMSQPVKQALDEFLMQFGNPSGIYEEGKSSHSVLEQARRSVARLLNCTAKRVLFTGGGSEANNLALKGIAFRHLGKAKKIITSQVEHPSILNCCNWLEQKGFLIEYLSVDPEGLVDPAELEQKIDSDTILVSIMMANNETGTIQPIPKLCEVAHQKGVLFHTDAVQAVGKIPVDVMELDVDLLSLAGHKFHGPKGVGALYRKKGVELDPLIHGGGQESALRGGTENIHGIVGLGKACEVASENLEEMKSVGVLRDKVEQGILDLLPKAKTNGDIQRRLPNTLNMTLPGFRGESLVLALDQKGISLSSGSACRSGSPKPSHALMALGLSEEEAHCALRMSLGLENTQEEIEYFLASLKQVIDESEQIVRFVPCR